jgi:hypothetical protein|tara:strand:+ start:305 stop:1006 length:702 start_codon:yes stop_codon:yes gene_type:complete
MKQLTTTKTLGALTGLALATGSANAAVVMLDDFESMGASGISADATQEANSAWTDVTSLYNASTSPIANKNDNARTDQSGHDGSGGNAGRGMRVRSSTGAATLDAPMALSGETSVTIAFDLKENTSNYVLALQYSSTADFASPVEIDRFVGLGANPLGTWVAKSYALTDGVGGINFSDDAYFMIRKISVAGTNGGANSTFHVFDNISVTSVPEPSSTALLGLGGLALILRRRK